MKNITLINPEQAREVFISNGWTNNHNYFIKIEGDGIEKTLVDSILFQDTCDGDLLKIKFGSEYKISLKEFDNELEIELRNIDEIGALIYINKQPYYLCIFRNTNSESISHIGSLYPELRLIDFGSCKNEYIENIQCIATCSDLETLNLDNCPNLKDISLLSSFRQLQTLFLDGFEDSTQYSYISNCSNLKNLSQNNSNLDSIQHLSGLKELESFYGISNSNLIDISPLSGLSSLTSLNLNKSEMLTDLTPLSCLNALTSLDLSDCMNLTDLSPLSGLTKLTTLNLHNCDSLTDDISPLSCMSSLTSLNLSYCPITDISPLSGLTALTTLNLNSPGLNNSFLTDLSPLSGLTALTSLDLSNCQYITDISPLRGLTSLTYLNLSGQWRSAKELSNSIVLTDISPLSDLTALTSLDLSNCASVSDFSPISGLKALTWFNLSGCQNLTDLSPLSGLSSLTSLGLSNCENLTDISALSRLRYLTYLNLSSCSILADLSPLSELKTLISLDLSFCENLADLSPLRDLTSLNSLDLMYCYKIVLIKPLHTLNCLLSLKLNDCPNIRDFDTLSSLLQLRELIWIDPVACSEVLMQCACNREDVFHIENKMLEWINAIQLCKNPNSFIGTLLNTLRQTSQSFQYTNLLEITQEMRLRGVQSDVLNDINVESWENWCSIVINLPLQEALECLDSAIADLDIVRETEVVMGPVIVAYSDLAELYPKEKENFLQIVKNILQLLDGHAEEVRQIAPSAAVFYASLKMREEVLFWLDKATDEKAPQWRERVLLALIKHYSRNEKFSEAQRLLDEMIIQDEKDMAIAIIAEHMTSKHPLDASFLLDEIKDLRISSSTAKKMLAEPAMFVKPQSLYQLLLHLQETPDELAACLEAIISKDTTGKSADALRNLFVKKISSEPSALKFLELCEHKAISDFVKPRALEKFKKYLTEKSEIESTTAIPFFILALQEHELINMEEADELTQQMK